MTDTRNDNDKKPVISVIMPIYNSGRYLSEALESILRQTFEDIEIICTDAASEDNSREILLEYARRDSRIIPILLDHNQGLCQSRNIGLLRSRGEFVMFADSDDKYFDDTCAKAYEKIRSGGADILQFGIRIIVDGNVPKEAIAGLKAMLNSEDQVINGDILKACFLEHRFNPQLLNKIFRGSIIRRAAKEIEPGQINYAEDWYLFCITAYYARSLVSISEPLYVYRLGTGVSTKKFDTMARFERILDEKKVSDAISRFLKREEAEGRYDDVAAWIASHFVEESVFVWTRDVRGTEWSVEAFKKLADTYGEEVIDEYADQAASGLRREVSELKSEIARLEDKLQKNRKRTAALESELEEIKGSKAYKAGSRLAAPLRKLRGVNNKLRRSKK